jgi:hypothetical protein
MSNFTKVLPGTTPKAKWVRHNIGEVVNTITEARQVAGDISNQHKYTHRARVKVVGTPNIRPYDPIYLDGLPNGMSGYWTVLLVQHVFGAHDSMYYLNLEVGTDVLGDTNPNAAYTSTNRNIVAELANQSIVPGQTTLINTALPINGNTTPVPTALLSVVTTPGVGGITGTLHSNGLTTVPATTDPFALSTPNFANVKRSVAWSSTGSVSASLTSGAATAVSIPAATKGPTLI